MPVALALAYSLSLGSACGDDDGGSAADASPGGDGEPDAGGPPTITLRTYDGSYPMGISLVAYQDGDGPWQLLEGDDGVYAFAVESGRYQLATVCDEYTHGMRPVKIRVLRALVTDVTELTLECAWHARNATIIGSVTGITAGQAASVNFGTADVFVTAASPSYTATLLAGTSDVIAARRDDMAQTLFRMDIQRGVALADQATHDFDLETGGFAPTTHQIAVSGGVGGEDIFVDSGFITQGGGRTMLANYPALEYGGVPAEQLEPEDIHVVRATAGNFSDYREVHTFLHTPADVSLTLPVLGSAPTVTVVSNSPFVRLAYAPVVAADHQVHNLQSHVLFEGRWLWNDVVTRAWIDAGHAVETPDLSGLEGWDPEWSSGRQPGKALQYNAFTYSGTGNVSDLLLALAFEPGSIANPPHSGLDGLSYTGTMFINQFIP